MLGTRDRIVESLPPGGEALLVHWTPPVKGHASSAREVHEAFSQHPELRTVEHRDVLDLFAKLKGM